MLQGKRILLGIGGGIAVYRVAELARLLLRQRAEVRCVMTSAARQFVSPLTFEALTGQQVHTDLFDLTSEREMGHIRLVREADVLLVAPATAGLIARFAHGMADDLLTTMWLAADIPCLLAPAMNSIMWQAEAVQQNIALLQARGMRIIGPDTGELACGEQGPGRLSEPDTMLAAVRCACTTSLLQGQRWIINTGPTQERWDDVRLLSNRASGMLGLHLAEAAAAAGARVTLVAGPGVARSAMPMQRVDVESAQQMHEVCMAQAADADVFVAAAAVSDYRIAKPVRGKLKRQGGGVITLQLTENPDIVAAVAHMARRPRRVIAFAAERERHLDHARRKLQAKGVDAIIANDAGRMGSVLGGGWWLTAGQVVELPEMPKWQLAGQLVEMIEHMEGRA